MSCDSFNQFNNLLLVISITLVGAVGGEAIGLLEGSEMDLLAGLAFPVEADGLNLDDVVRLLLQVPENAGAAGGVDFPDEPLRVSLLSLREAIKAMLNTKQIRGPDAVSHQLHVMN